jgi:hypothetical protein
MIELLLCMAGVLAMAVLALAPWTFLVQGGAAVAVLGLLVGLPTGLAYHVQLRRELARCGPVAARWWMHPTGQHGRLDEAGKEAIRTMFRLGGAGCGVVFFGCFVVLIGILRSGAFLSGS